MKYIMMVVMLMGLSGCGKTDPRHQVALNNYAKVQCDGKIIIGDWTFLTSSGYTCITDNGAEYRTVNTNTIPAKYWEIE